jgi:hypothetical protein
MCYETTVWLKERREVIVGGLQEVVDTNASEYKSLPTPPEAHARFLAPHITSF